MPTRSELAWAAGLFEGEGSFIGWPSSPKRNRQLFVALSMTDEDVVRRFADVVGFGTIIKEQWKGTRKPIWRWRASSFQAFQQLVCYFWPYLGDRRKSRAVELQKAYLASGTRQDHLVER